MGCKQLESICTAKETRTKSKRQPTEWEKIVAKAATDKGFIYKIYQQRTNSTAKQQTTQVINNRQETYIDISPEKTCRWAMDIGKIAEHHYY